jgi:hypothetical protein
LANHNRTRDTPGPPASILFCTAQKSAGKRLAVHPQVANKWQSIRKTVRTPSQDLSRPSSFKRFGSSSYIPLFSCCDSCLFRGAMPILSLFGRTLKPCHLFLHNSCFSSHAQVPPPACSQVYGDSAFNVSTHPRRRRRLWLIPLTRCTDREDQSSFMFSRIPH